MTNVRSTLNLLVGVLNRPPTHRSDRNSQNQLESFLSISIKRRDFKEGGDREKSIWSRKTLKRTLLLLKWKKKKKKKKNFCKERKGEKKKKNNK